MSFLNLRHKQQRESETALADCQSVQAEFSAYLDGAISGRKMAAIASHLKGCEACRKDFAIWRSMGTALADLGPARAPENLQSRLRSLAAAERELGAHLSLGRRFLLLWQTTLAPLSVRMAGGLAFAAVLALGVGRVFGPAAAVQANDDRMAHFVGPRYLYSVVPQQPVEAGRDVPVLVDAQVDERGQVYDFTILEGPADPKVRVRLEANLLASVFRPASLFGEPVRGHAVLTFAGVSVRP